MTRGIIVRNTTVLILLLLVLSIVHVQMGEVSVSFTDAWNSIFSLDTTNPTQAELVERIVERATGAGATVTAYTF